MAGGTRGGKIDQARVKIKELEGRLLKLEGQLKVLQGQTRQARGTARVRLARLEKNAASQVARVEAALRISRAHELLHASAAEARVLSRGLRAGVTAGREAFRRSRRG